MYSYYKIRESSPGLRPKKTSVVKSAIICDLLMKPGGETWQLFSYLRQKSWTKRYTDVLKDNRYAKTQICHIKMVPHIKYQKRMPFLIMHMYKTPKDSVMRQRRTWSVSAIEQADQESTGHTVLNGSFFSKNSLHIHTFLTCLTISPSSFRQRLFHFRTFIVANTQ